LKRLVVLALLALAFGLATFAQEHQPAADRAANPAREERTTEPEGNLELWKWANFLILAGVLGWLIWKNAPPFFRSRTEEIQRGIAAAAKLKREAEERAAKVEARMASLQSEIEHVRADSKAVMTRESDRLRKETEQHIARIQSRGEEEIGAISKHAEKDLRAFAAQLAIQLAEERIRSRMSDRTQNALVDGFVKQLDRRAASPEARL
jgi:F-type H+-transporting ATPase subunit b